MSVYGSRTTVTGTCGLGVFYDFALTNSQYTYRMRLNEMSRNRGASFAVAGFVNTLICKQAYEELNQRFKTVYQSPVRLNRNSSKRFFFVIYDTRSAPPNSTRSAP